MNYTVRYFKPGEFRCPCCGAGAPARLLVVWLDLFRSAWGYPVKINSGFRCARHNKEVGGAERSRHLLGCAADIAPVFRHRTGGEMEAFKALARRMFGISGWEVKEYPTFVHVAVPRDEEGRRWGGAGVIQL